MAVAFSTDSSHYMSSTHNQEEGSDRNKEDLAELDENLDEEYEIQRCVGWIKSRNFKKVALQFPDDLLVDAPDVALRIEKAADDIEVYILGDTSYGSCCVDEIAAEHVNADSLIHFGGACLSPTRRIPVLYVFTRLPFDQTSAVEAFKSVFESKDSRVLVLFDVRYHSYMAELNDKLSSDYSNLIVSELDIPDPDSKPILDQTRKCGRKFILKDPVEDYTVFYIGEEGLTLNNILMNFNKCQFVTYCSKRKTARIETLNVNKVLMKRYYLIEKAKDAERIGILVGTLAVADYLKAINHLKELIRKAGRKSYIFAVGKVSPAKLANFPEIDIYVLVACPENSMLDSKDFFKPILQPFELEIAFNQARTWTGDYVTDFRELLPGAAKYVDLSVAVEPYSDLSLVSGKMRTVGIEGRSPDHTTSYSLTVRDTYTVATGSASEFLANRSWKGLDPMLGQTPVTLATEGLTGVAWGYEGEGEKNVPRGKPDGEE